MSKCRSSGICWLLALLVGLTGCSQMLTRPAAPTVSLNDIRVIDATLFEQRYELSLRIQNPNAFDLPVKGMHYRLLINDKEFATGVSNTIGTLPAYGESLVKVTVVSNLINLYKQFQFSSGQHDERITYTLDGALRVTGSLVDLPFRYHGEIPLLPQN